MIKFRIWDNTSKKMYYTDKDLSLTFFKDKIIAKYSSEPYELLYDVSNFELMQSTGLKDRHGNMIYEGDIVDKGYHNYKIYPNQWGSVGMGEIYGSGYACNKWFGWLTSAGYSLLDIYDVCEVLGNIYENPELMEDERYFNLYDFQTKL